MKTADLLRNFQPRAAELSAVTQQLFRTLATPHFLFGRKTFNLLQASLEEKTDILQPFDGPLQIFLAPIFVLFGLHLIRKRYHIADIKGAGREFVANPE